VDSSVWLSWRIKPSEKSVQYFVDTGLLRKDEANKVEAVFKKNFRSI
jgi:GMP synthase PP-ATPase subunit